MTNPPEEPSPIMTRGVSLTEDVNLMLEELAYYHDISASAVIRALIEREHAASAEAIKQHKARVR